MKEMGRILTGVILGGASGLIFGALLGSVSGPHNYVEMSWTEFVARSGATAGFVGGGVVSVIDWLLRRKNVGKRVYEKINVVVSRKLLEVVFGMVYGSVFGSVIGGVWEVIVRVRKLRLVGGFFFDQSELGEANFVVPMIVVPVVGACVGGIWGLIQTVAREDVERLISELGSGVILGIIVGAPFGFFGILYLGVLTIVFGVWVSVTNGIVTKGLFRNNPLSEENDASL